MASEIDYKAWVVSLCTLLDKIDLEADVAEDVDGSCVIEIARLCRMRHDIARDHGLEVVFEGAPTSARMDH